MSNPYDDPNFSYDDSPDLYLFTSLTAGSSHIITATSRLETILKANRVPFHAIDCATDEKARRIWTRRGQGKKLPGLVREGVVLGDLETVEEWNEYGEIKDHLGGPPLAKKQTRTPAQDTVGGGNMATQPLPIRTKEASGETTTAAQTLQNSQAALLAQQAAAAGKARAIKGPTPGVDASKVRSLADAETDPETVKNTEKNASPEGEKKTSPLEAEAAAEGETAAPTRSSAASPEADNADINLSSPPTSTATIAHGAISAAQEKVDPLADKTLDASTENNVKDETKEDGEEAKDSAAKNDVSTKESIATSAKATEDATKQNDDDTTTAEDTPTEKPSGQKVSFAPDATREDAEKKEPKKAFEEEAAASKKGLATGAEAKKTSDKIESGEDKTETKEIAGAKDPDAAGDSVED